MGLATNIVRRAGSARYYTRLAVPADLQPLMGGKRELWKSLGTADPRVARERAAPILALWHGEFADLRRKRAPSEDDLQAAVWRTYQTEIDRDRVERANMPKATDIEAAKAAYADDLRTGKTTPDDLGREVDVLALAGTATFLRQSRKIREAALREHVATGETEPTHWRVDDVIAREKLLIKHGSPEYFDLAQRLQRAELEALRRASERDEGDWGGAIRDPLVKPAKPSEKVATAKPGETIMELYDRFATEKAGAASADTWTQNRKLVRLFAEFVGETSGAEAVNRLNVRNWKQALAKWPIKANEMKAFRGKSFRDVIAANVGIGKRTIDPKTVNKYLASVGAFGRWLLSNGYVDQDISSGLFLAVDKSARTRLPLTSDQLTKLFTSPLFTGFEADRKEHLPGKLKTRDWRFWIPLIALFSGARLGEIAQLHTDDVRQLHGVWIFHVTEEGGGKSVKTGGSERIVPIHSELIRLGLLDYLAARKAAKAKRLFDVARDTRGFASGVPSKFLNGYLRDIGVKIDKSVNVHSFRHGVADALRRAGFRDEEFGFLLGHAKATTTGRYGIEPEGALRQRVTMIEAVTFPGLDLSRLYASRPA